jgi:hypothetical protein
MLTSEPKKIEALLKTLIQGGVGSIRGEFEIYKNKLNHRSIFYRFKRDPDLNLDESYAMKLHDFSRKLVENVKIPAPIGGNDITNVKYEEQKNPAVHELVYNIIDAKIKEIYTRGDIRLGLFVVDANYKTITIVFEDCVVFNKKFY